LRRDHRRIHNQDKAEIKAEFFRSFEKGRFRKDGTGPQCRENALQAQKAHEGGPLHGQDVYCRGRRQGNAVYR